MNAKPKNVLAAGHSRQRSRNRLPEGGRVPTGSKDNTRPQANARSAPVKDVAATKVEHKLKQATDIVAERMLERLRLDRLTVPSQGSRTSHLDYLSQCCVEIEQTLSMIHGQELTEYHRTLLSARIEYRQDRTKTQLRDYSGRSENERWMRDPNERSNGDKAREKARADRRKSAETSVVQSQLKEIGIGPFALFGGPWLTHDRIEQSASLEQLFADGKEAYRRKAYRVAHMFVDGFRQGMSKQIYGDYRLGADSLSYTYYDHCVTDVIEQETLSSRQRGLLPTYDVDVTLTANRKTERRIMTQDLLDPQFHTLEGTLKNPALDVPEHYREALGRTPGMLRDLVHVVFGTQIVERQVAQEVGNDQIEQTFELERNLRRNPERDRQVAVPYEPAAILFDSVVAFGWGQTSMNRQQQFYDEQDEVLERQRVLRDESIRLHSQARTRTRIGWLLVAIIAAEVFLLSFQSLAIALLVFLGPAAFAIWLLITKDLSRKADAAEAQSEENYRAGYEMLKNKYGPLDPSKPRLPRP